MIQTICIATTYHKGGERCTKPVKIGEFCGIHGKKVNKGIPCKWKHCHKLGQIHDAWEHAGRWDKPPPVYPNDKNHFQIYWMGNPPPTCPPCEQVSVVQEVTVIPKVTVIEQKKIQKKKPTKKKIPTCKDCGVVTPLCECDEDSDEEIPANKDEKKTTKPPKPPTKPPKKIIYASKNQYWTKDEWWKTTQAPFRGEWFKEFPGQNIITEHENFEKLPHRVVTDIRGTKCTIDARGGCPMKFEFTLEVYNEIRKIHNKKMKKKIKEAKKAAKAKKQVSVVCSECNEPTLLCCCSDEEETVRCCSECGGKSMDCQCGQFSSDDEYELP
jgi:hypothetical protein